jgi:hypothetical protein
MELSKFARRTVERARRVVEKGRDVPAEDMLGLHALRISYKELRYSIELLAEALPLDSRAMLEPAVVFQKRLGEIHDVDVAHDVLRAARALPPEAREQALAALAKVREKRIGKYLRELDPLGAVAAPEPPAQSAKEELVKAATEADGPANHRQNGVNAASNGVPDVADDLEDAVTVSR